MTVRYICGNCGFVLREVTGPREFLPTPRSVAASYNYKCPNCGANLLGAEPSIAVYLIKDKKKHEREEKKIMIDKRDKVMVTVSMRIPTWMDREIVYLAEKHKYRSKSAFMRAALLHYIKKLHEEEEKAT
jgi:ribosomal protein S27AE